MAESEEAIRALLDGIDYLIETKINNAPFDRLINAVITRVNLDGTYMVNINSNDYDNVSSMVKGLNVNDTVYVVLPQNQMNQMFILGKLNMPINAN